MRDRPNQKLKYALAVALPALAFAIRILSSSAPGAVAPFMGYFLATVISAAIGGAGPGMVAAILGVFLAAPLHSPGGWMHLSDPADPTAPLRYLTACGFVSVVCETLIRSRERARNAELRLRESEERFRFVANSAPVFIWMSGPDKLCTWFNEPWLEYRGRTMEQEIGNGWATGVHPEDLAHCLETYNTNFDARKPFSMQYRLRDRHGDWRWVLDRGVPHYGPGGAFMGYIGCCIEIDEQKRTEEALRWANADLEQFAYSAGHDLREPIRNVAIYTEVIAKQFEPRMNPEERRHLGFVTDGARRLEALVDGLLKYTTVLKMTDAGSVADAEAVLKTALDTLAKSIRDHGATITHGPLPELRIHDVHLEQLFQNLMANALKYRSAEPPRIHISAEPDQGHWNIAVADNGIGIEPQYQRSIFGLFKRLHGADKYPGTGLGLTICQRIVHLYGGRIWVNSEVGKGSTFYFSLKGAEPIAKEDAAAAQEINASL